jgi:hypothetical protein
VQVVKTERSSEDILNQLQQKLDRLISASPDNDKVH